MSSVMEERARLAIASGHPIVVAHIGEDHNITKTEEYNMENFQVQQWQIERMARVLYPRIAEFFADPEKAKEFEEWSAAERAKKSD